MDQPGRHHTDESRTQLIRVPNPAQRAVLREDAALWGLLAVGVLVLCLYVLVAS